MLISTVFTCILVVLLSPCPSYEAYLTVDLADSDSGDQAAWNTRTSHQVMQPHAEAPAADRMKLVEQWQQRTRRAWKLLQTEDAVGAPTTIDIEVDATWSSHVGSFIRTSEMWVFAAGTVALALGILVGVVGGRKLLNMVPSKMPNKTEPAGGHGSLQGRFASCLLQW